MKSFRIIFLLLIVACSGFVSCMKYGPVDEEDFDWGDTHSGDGVFITNEGNFMYGNSSLSLYVPSEKKVYNEVFIRANSMKFGDVTQSMVIRGNRGYIAVNNSGVIFVIDIDTFKVTGMIEGLVSPRYIHFMSDDKAYVTDLYAAQITVINPKTYRITGYIDTGGHTSTEQMVQYGRYVFTNCWSYDNSILVIDSSTDRMVDVIEVGIQPTSIVMDKYGKIWVTTDGGYEGSPYGWEEPSLCRIDAATREVEKRFRFTKGEQLSDAVLNGTKDTLYFINKSVWRMGVAEDMVPVRPFLEYSGTIYYGLGVNPVNSDVYVADAIDYVQPGIVYRYNSRAEQLDVIRVGITPGAFCFK